MSRLDYVRDLYRLRQIAEGGLDELDTSRLEAEIAAAARGRDTVLEIGPGQHYALRGEEVDHYAEATGRHSAPRFIDDGGWCAEDPLDDAERLVVVSPRQRTGRLAARFAPLRPLLDEVYRRGAILLEDFTIHEALCGRVTASRGQLPLGDLPLFPRRFAPGPYRLAVTLDTPRRTVARFGEVMQALDALRAEPTGVLDLEGVEALAADALELRRRIGALSRYRLPGTASFAVEVPACVVHTARGAWYLLYSAEHHRNVLVHFGGSPFAGGGEPPGLLVLDGDQREQVLSRLLELDLLVPAPVPEIERRVAAMTALVRGGSGPDGLSAKAALGDALAALERLRDGLAGAHNRSRYLRGQAPEALLDLAVAPAAGDPVAGLLLPRLSWHQPTRRYHDTAGFIRRFQRVDDDGRRELLGTLRGCLALGSPQNRAVNAWLHHHHRGLCGEAGLAFVERAGLDGSPPTKMRTT
jgi:hypothetical protein